MKVLGVGDNVIDRYCHTGMGYPGGNALNFSVYAAMLAADSAYLGIFGNDLQAQHLQQVLTRRQVDISHCLQAEGETGHANLTSVDGERIFLDSNQGGLRRHIAMDFILQSADWLEQFDLMHTSAYSYMDHLLPQLAALPGKLSYDFSDDFDLHQVLPLCRWLDFAFFSCAEHDDEAIVKLLTEVHHQGCPVVVATRGAKGALLFDGEHWLQQAPKPLIPVDTLGAGDAFITAFLLQQLSGAGLTESLKSASDFAGKICALNGSFGDPLPLDSL